MHPLYRLELGPPTSRFFSFHWTTLTTEAMKYEFPCPHPDRDHTPQFFFVFFFFLLFLDLSFWLFSSFSSLLFNFFLFFSSYPSLLISSYSSRRYYFLSSYSSPLIFLTVDIHISVILRGFSRGNKPFLTHLGVTIRPNFFVLFFFFFSSYIFTFFSTVLYSSSSYSSLLKFKLIVTYMHIKHTQGKDT